MNVLKLLHCSWKHPISRNESKVVQYYIQYERVNHIENQVLQGEGGLRAVLKHEDVYDREIFDRLSESLNEIPGIEQLKITTSETILYDQNEEMSRALYSNLAFGSGFRGLLINTREHCIINLSTRIFFTDLANEANQNAILPSIPMVLNLNVNGLIPSLIRADFLSRQRVDQILDRENGIDLSRFQQ